VVLTSFPESSAAERKPTLGFWAGVIAICACAYLLSFGPAIWLVDRRVLPAWVKRPVALFYAPVFHLSLAGPRPIRQAIVWYGELGTRRYADPLLDDPATPAIEQ
jgi:hypothetical protein